jgi:PadR family transcriptional regulator, regulatory protein PadR
MNSLDFHLLLALATGPLHGYAIKDAIAAESSQTIEPRAGSLYRVIARLITAGLVKEVKPPGDAPPHPGLARRYYALTTSGRRALAAEAQRRKHSAVVAERRLGLARGGS